MDLPLVDEVTAPWWEATRDRRLLVQRCERCGHHQHYPRPLCLACASTDLGFVPASGNAVVHSWTVVHRAPDPAFEPPYAVALVRLAEGPILLSAIIDADLDALRCELPVSLRWRPLADGRHLPVFTPTEMQEP
jgi:uncharacterized protein